MGVDLDKLKRLAYLTVNCPDTALLIGRAIGEIRDLRGDVERFRCAAGTNASLYRDARSEIERLKSRVHDLEAEAMKTGGELVMEVGRRMMAERRLKAMEENASAPAAIVSVYHEDRLPDTHAFADADDALRFCHEQRVAEQRVAVMQRTPGWTWHPADGVNVDTAPDGRGT